MFQPEVNDALKTLTTRLAEEMPEFAEAVRVVREQGGSEADVLARLASVFATRPELVGRIERLAAEVFAPLQDTAVARSTPWAEEARGVIEAPSGRGAPRLNPAYEAALAERIQFDGDVPELRTGPLPEGATPAVPVETTARDAAAIGLMLDSASQGVIEEMKAIEAAHLRQIEAGGTGLIPVDPQNPLAVYEKANLPDPPGYRRGELPAAVAVITPPGSALATLTPEQRQMAAWRFLSTTQGRRSATKVISELVAVGLRSDGHEVVEGSGEPGRVDPTRVLVHAEWSVDIEGPNATQANFAFIDVAAKALIRKVEDALAGRNASGTTLEVVSINAVDVRKVGWGVRLVQP